MTPANYHTALEIIRSHLHPASVFMMVGGPGSGKSYVSKRLAAELEIPLIASDDIRFKLTGDEANWEIEPVIWKTMHAYVEHYLAQGTSVIVEATHYDHDDRTATIELYRPMSAAKIIGIPVTAGLELAAARNARRPRVVPEADFLEMHQALIEKPATLADGFDLLIPIDNSSDDA